MNGLLQHLAARALGEQLAGAAHLSLPSRFAQAHVVNDTHDDDAVGTLGSPSASSVTTPDALPALTHDTVQTASVSPIAWRRDEPSAAPSLSSPLAMSRMAEAAARAEPAPLRAILPNAPPPHPIDSERRALPAAHLLNLATAPSPPHLRPVTPLPMSSLLHRPQTPDAAPLSEATVAARPAMVGENRPVVHVTIDRIDVRAAESPHRSPEPRRTRPQPAVSLADYLRESAQGTRR